METTCIFCNIARRSIGAEIVYEDETCLSFLDINPVNEGHVLVIPKEHFENMAMTPDELIGVLFQKAKFLMPFIQKATCADFVVLTVVGTDVPHFHIHLIPRFRNDGLSGFWPAKKYKDGDRMKEVSANIRKELESYSVSRA